MAAFHHVHIKSHDPRAAARWWAGMFGAALLPEITFGDMLFAPVELGGVRINITTPAPGEGAGIGQSPGIPHYGLEHLGIEVDDLDALLGRFAEQGLTIYERRSGAGGYEIAFVEAPDGVCLELLERPGS